MGGGRRGGGEGDVEWGSNRPSSTYLFLERAPRHVPKLGPSSASSSPSVRASSSHRACEVGGGGGEWGGGEWGGEEGGASTSIRMNPGLRNESEGARREGGMGGEDGMGRRGRGVGSGEEGWGFGNGSEG